VRSIGMSAKLTRFLVTASAVASIAMLTPASARMPAAGALPSKLDYVVLASLADSPNPLAMSTYR
jgi:hypothetical protein